MTGAGSAGRSGGAGPELIFTSTMERKAACRMLDCVRRRSSQAACPGRPATFCLVCGQFVRSGVPVSVVLADPDGFAVDWDWQRGLTVWAVAGPPFESRFGHRVLQHQLAARGPARPGPARRAPLVAGTGRLSGAEPSGFCARRPQQSRLTGGRLATRRPRVRGAAGIASPRPRARGPGFDGAARPEDGWTSWW